MQTQHHLCRGIELGSQISRIDHLFNPGRPAGLTPFNRTYNHKSKLSRKNLGKLGVITSPNRCISPITSFTCSLVISFFLSQCNWYLSHLCPSASRHLLVVAPCAYSVLIAIWNCKSPENWLPACFSGAFFCNKALLIFLVRSLRLYCETSFWTCKVHSHEYM